MATSLVAASFATLWAQPVRWAKNVTIPARWRVLVSAFRLLCAPIAVIREICVIACDLPFVQARADGSYAPRNRSLIACESTPKSCRPTIEIEIAMSPLSQSLRATRHVRF